MLKQRKKANDPGSSNDSSVLDLTSRNLTMHFDLSDEDLTSEIHVNINDHQQSPGTNSTETVLIQVNEDKNVITKEDVEKVLDLKFVNSRIKRDLYIAHSGVNDMKLSYHNMGAFEAYQRAKAQRIAELAKIKYKTSDLNASELPPHLMNNSLTNSNNLKKIHRNIGKNAALNSNCSPASKSCHIVRKTRRLAEALISNLEEIKFFAGGTCGVCGRESCDGINHFPVPPPVEQMVQVQETEIFETMRKKSSEPRLDQLPSIPSLFPSEPAFETRLRLKSKDELDSIFGISGSDEKDSPESSDKEDVFQSFVYDADLEFPSTFTINFINIELKSDGVEMLEFSERATKGYKLKYIFLMYKEIVDIEPLLHGITMELNSLRLHPFSMNSTIYQYLTNCSLHIELYDTPMSSKRKPKFLGNCDLCFDKLFYDLDEPIKMSLPITDKDRIAFVTNGKQMVFGHLNVEVTLSADEEHVASLARSLRGRSSPIDIMGTGSFTDFMERTESVKSLTRSTMNLVSDARMMLLRDYDLIRDVSHGSLILNAYEKGLITELEQKAFTDALQLVLVRNKALRTRQSEIDTELNDRAEWMHEELKWRLTLQEHAILSGKDPESVRWRQWRDENTSDVRFRTIMDEEIAYEPVVIITVEYLDLLPTSQAMLDETIKLIYIEYAFLTHSGLELETKSLPKNAKGLILYNFEKRFDISIDRDNIDTQVLAEHIKTNQNIKFTAVHEPIEDPEELQTCMAIGSCDISLFSLAQRVSNTHEEVYPLKNAKYGLQDVGYLKLRFDGVRAMRTVALTLLAPSAFKIYR